jgi:PadR family transcriptional regulator, regulatory protein PadR
VGAVAEPPPLREPTFFILAALAPGPLHGYGVIKAVEEMSGGRVRLRAGTLYGALERLHDDGLVEFAGESHEGGPPRRNYRLTARGSQTLTRDAERLRANADVALARLRERRT